MSDRYPGGLIRKTPPTITPPVGGEGGSAPGVWTLEQASYYTKTGVWPQKFLPRELYTWGNFNFGQGGTGNKVTTSSPVQVGSTADAYNIVASGLQASYFIRLDNTLWSTGNGAEGRLGHNNQTDCSSPIQIGALTNWSSVSAGDSFAVAVKTDGTLWTWGEGLYGQIGQNNTINYSSPVQVGSATDWSYATAGFQYVVAVKTTGALWAWGRNNVGQLGDGTVILRSSPVQVGALTNWSKVAGSNRHTIAVKTDGSLWAVGGDNERGCLGLNITGTYRSSPTQIGALTNWSTIALVDAGSLAIKTDGTLWVWGIGENGETAQNNNVNYSSPVQIGSGTNWSDIGTLGRSDFGIKTDGTLWAWGRNFTGALGLNDSEARSSPVQVGSDTNWSSMSSNPGSAVMGAIKKG